MKIQPIHLLGLLLILAACRSPVSSPAPSQTPLPATATRPIPTLTRAVTSPTPTPGERTREAGSLAAQVAAQTATEAWVATMVRQTDVVSEETANAGALLPTTTPTT